MKEEYYSLAQVAQICNRDKSTVSRKLSKNNLEDMKNLINPQIVKRNGYNNKEQLFFNEYAVKYIISLCYKNLDYYQIEDINLNDLQKYYLDKN
ncbi:TPA: helix-turn-helix domain-containing protein, partial [Staphylococcus aureus]|nr:helix-turn-helix domain-containing protein [Staphylococcus aureus]